MKKPKKNSVRVFGKADHNSTIYLLIGQLIIHWANNESLFMRILYTLLGATMKEASTVFYAHKNTQGRLDLVLALGNAKIADPELKRELNKLVSDFKGLSRARNHYAHATYRYDDELRILDADGIIFDNRDQIYKHDVKRFTPATINEIDDANMRAVTMNRALWGFAHRLDRHFGMTPEMPQQVPVQLLDELREQQSPPTTQKGE